jgi:hypothetical protein
MKMDMERMDVWVVGLTDQPGELSEKLRGLAEAGANLHFLLARRTPAESGKAVAFVAPIKGARQTKAAKQMGFHKSKTLCGVQVTAADKPGLATALTEALADCGINLRGFSGVTVGKRAVFHIACDTPSDAARAIRSFQKITA